MNFISVAEAMKHGSGRVAVRGWCYRERKSNQKAFIVLRDASTIIQCVVDKATARADVWDAANKVSIEASLEVEGEIRADSRAPTGFEIKVEDLRLIGLSDVFPITKDQSTEFLLDVRHLWLRSRQLAAVLKVRSAVFGAIDEFFRKRGYYETQSPIFTPTSCEGGSTLFEVKYFGDKAYLTQSWQLYAEAVMFALEKIYCIAPCFRAEKSRTARHLTEFWMAEAEAAWMSFDELLTLEEEFISFLCQRVAERCSEELKLLGRDPADLLKIKPPFPRITYDEAVALLKKDGVEFEWGTDLRTLEEEQLMKHFDKPLIITRYPKKIKAFYMKEDPANPSVVLCADMIAPEVGEITGGSERETNYDKLVARLEESGEKTEHYQWYLDLRKYGSVSHSGFGLGVERFIRWICKLESIRDTIAFPRTINRTRP
jgi:asparaginyl-tRNA synthetase